MNLLSVKICRSEELYADKDIELKLLTGKTSKVTKGFAAGTGNITLTITDSNGDEVKLEAGKVIFSKFAGATFEGKISLTNKNNNSLTLKRDPKNYKVVAAIG